MFVKYFQLHLMEFLMLKRFMKQGRKEKFLDKYFIFNCIFLIICLFKVGASSTIGSNSGEFIPLDDTIRLKGNKQTGERSRLIREDENDISDEDEGGRYNYYLINFLNLFSFYSAKKLLQTEEDARREEQANFLSMEQGSSGEEENNGQRINGRKQRSKQTKKLNKNISDEEEEEEEDELRRWEHEQIRKGVSSNKVILN